MAQIDSNVLNNVLRDAKEMITSGGWTQESNDGTTKLESKPYPGSTINAFRATTLLDCSPETAAQRYWDLTLAELQQLDPTVSSLTDIETLDDGSRVRTQINTLPWPVWARQTIFVEKKICDEEGFWHVTCSTTHPRVTVDTTQYVQATVHTGLFYFKAEGDKCRMWRVIHLDANGNLPTFVVNNGADNVAGCCRWFRQNMVRAAVSSK